MGKTDWAKIDWDKIKIGVSRYNEIMESIKPLDEKFQNRFSLFYKVRRNLQWKKDFFQIFQKSSKDSQFKDILIKLKKKTGRIEASFASKMLHTLNPQMPIWDSIVVIHQLGIKVPIKKYKATDNDEDARMNKIISIYEQLRKGYNCFINTDQGKKIIKEFDKKNPKTSVKDIKKIDFILWASGKSSILTKDQQNLFKLK